MSKINGLLICLQEPKVALTSWQQRVSITETVCFDSTKIKPLKKTDDPKSGQKPLQDLMECFSKACNWLEAEVTPYSVLEFREKMIEIVNGKDVYGVQYIKKLLTDRYKDHNLFCYESGRENVVYLKNG